MDTRPKTPEPAPTVVNAAKFDTDPLAPAHSPVNYRTIVDVPPSTGNPVHASGPDSPAQRRSALSDEPTAGQVADATVVMPGSSEQIAAETAAVSPEGMPADPKAGPRGLRLELLVAVVAVSAISIGLGFWFGPAVGVVTFLIAGLFLLFNPVFGATMGRAKDRKEVLMNHPR